MRHNLGLAAVTHGPLGRSRCWPRQAAPHKRSTFVDIGFPELGIDKLSKRLQDAFYPECGPATGQNKHCFLNVALKLPIDRYSGRQLGDPCRHRPGEYDERVLFKAIHQQHPNAKCGFSVVAPVQPGVTHCVPVPYQSGLAALSKKCW